ncbi:response regulator [Nonlabens ponticola]|uniref:Response regulator transcription factor n=1 Tax=Nonlabens ponticola TaxID=2496866 RepID=A0A3S9N012_9FLAO|nr:response regulator [Nonlabens ponticola]AZQ44875.1 response regulator transcription factor [Nonlabens ponticola]
MKSILIVEDEVMIANGIEKMLRKHGYTDVMIAIDYEEALETLEENKVDLVLLDVNLSDEKNGIDLAATIKKNYHIPFIFLTSYTDPATLSKLKQVKPIGYLAKPIDQATLTANIDIYFANESDESTLFSFTIGSSVYQIDLAHLCYVQADHVYVELHLIDETVVVRSSLQALIEMFPENRLARINRSIAVNPDGIEKIEKGMIQIKDHRLKLSKTYQEEFFHKYWDK